MPANQNDGPGFKPQQVAPNVMFLPNQPPENSVFLTTMEKGYDRNYNRLEISTFSYDIHNKPGLYLQHVEGCGYQVYQMTPDEAEALGKMLIKQAAASKADFEKNKGRKPKYR